MVKCKPKMAEIQTNNCIGSLPPFEQLGMTASTHPKAQFATAENEFVIKFKTTIPVKLAGKIVNLDTSEESRESVFVQMRGDDVSVLVSLDHTGYHKLQLYALPRVDERQELPNVFNYVIQCTAVPRKCRRFPKQFTQWRDGCALFEPFSLRGEKVSGDVVFRVRIPDALAAAVTIGEDWFHLEPADDGIWQGQVTDIDRFKGCDLCAVVNANLNSEDESKYASLLQYRL